MIKSGRIRRRRAWSLWQEGDEEEAAYEMRFLDESALPEILDLQELVVGSLPLPEIFKPHEEGYFRELFRTERSALGVMAQEGLIAYSIIRLPGAGEDNLGRDIDLPEEELERVAHLQAAVVHPAHRGNALQRRMAAQHQRVIEELGYEHVCCTISPRNPHSLSNMLASGFGIFALKPKFDGWWRFIMYKNILHPMDFGAKGEEIRINASDIQGQIELLSRGFAGRRMIPLPGGFEVCYYRLRTSRKYIF